MERKFFIKEHKEIDELYRSAVNIHNHMINVSLLEFENINKAAKFILLILIEYYCLVQRNYTENLCNEKDFEYLTMWKNNTENSLKYLMNHVILNQKKYELYVNFTSP